MPVLTPPDRGDRDEITTAWLTPPPPPTWSERLLDALESPRNRALAVLTGLAVLLLGAVAVIGGDEPTVEAPQQAILTDSAGADAPRSGSVDLSDDAAADQADVDQAGAAQEPAQAPADDDPAGRDPADADSADSDPVTGPDEAALTPAEEEPPADEDLPPAVEDEPAEPTTTAAPTTEAPTTEAPTTEAPTTAAPTTPTTAAPTTTTTAAPTTAATAPPAPSGSGVQGQVLNLTNAERAKVGCPALTLDGRLNAASTAHSQDMAANGYFSHTGLNGSQPWDRSAAAGYPVSGIAENIAQGYGSPEAVVTGWMNSPGHRANIVNCSYKHMGLGHVASGNYWTQMFGAG